MSVNKIKFTLDNLIYNCTIKDDNDIQIILPRRTPNKAVYNSKNKKEKSVVITATEQVKIKVFIFVATENIPKINIKGEDNKVKLFYSNEINLLPKTQSILTFTTTDGGLSWLISFANYDKDGNVPLPSDAVLSVNGKSGPHIILDASDIDITSGPTIISLDEKIQQIEDELGNLVTILPGMIELKIGETKIIAETI